jgi:hypothetical protein
MTAPEMASMERATAELDASAAANIAEKGDGFAHQPKRKSLGKGLTRQASTLSSVIQREAAEMPGVSANAEKTIRAAISADPVMAYCDPTGLASLCKGVPMSILAAASEEIRIEAEKTVASYRQRKDAGDPELANWIDPDGYSFNLDEDCQSAPSI